MSRFSLTVLGARGSVPVSGPQYHIFGGATSCYRVRAGERTIFLDAGSGLAMAEDPPEDTPPVILLSHLHLDHVLGLGMVPRLSQPGKRTELYLPVREGETARETLDRLYGPPFWPCSLCEYSGELRLHAFLSAFSLGDVGVETVPGSHPGGCLVIRLRYEGKTIVYATDFEYEASAFQRLCAFAEGADLLLFDAQFTAEEARRKQGFGHSTAETAQELMEKSGAKRLLLIHHDPAGTDPVLLAREETLTNPGVRYAREGQVIEL